MFEKGVHGKKDVIYVYCIFAKEVALCEEDEEKYIKGLNELIRYISQNIFIKILKEKDTTNVFYRTNDEKILCKSIDELKFVEKEIFGKICSYYDFDDLIRYDSLM